MIDDIFTPAHGGVADGDEHMMTHVDQPVRGPVVKFVKKPPGGKAGSKADNSILQRGDAVALPPLDWIWQGYLLAGRTAILAGQPGQGKTSVAIDLAARVTNGATWPDGAAGCTPGDAILVSFEDGSDTLAARAKACGADMRRILIADTMAKNFSVSNLEAAIALLPNPRLLMIDPVTSIVGGDMNAANAVRVALAPYVAIAHRFQLCLLLVAHVNKGGGEGRSPLERISGSGAFGALPRVAMLAVEDKAASAAPHNRLLVRVKANEGRDDGAIRYALDRRDVAPGRQGQFVVWGGVVQGDARDIIAQAEAVADEAGGGKASRPDPDEELVALLQDFLSDGPRSAGEVFAEMSAAGFPKWRVDRAKTKAGITTQKCGMSGGWKWSLPEGVTLPKPSNLHSPSQIFAHLHKSSDFPPFPEDGGGGEA